DRRGQVDEGGRLAVDGAIAEQHPRYLQRVGAMVRAPGRVVVEEDLVGELAQAGGPGCPIAAAVADDEVGRQAGRAARVDLVRAVYAPHDPLTVEVRDGLQPARQLRQDRLALPAGLDDAVALA